MNARRAGLGCTSARQIRCTARRGCGFSNGTSVTLSNTSYYDGNWTISSASGNTFTITTNDYPNTTSLNSYTTLG